MSETAAMEGPGRRMSEARSMRETSPMEGPRGVRKSAAKSAAKPAETMDTGESAGMRDTPKAAESAKTGVKTAAETRVESPETSVESPETSVEAPKTSVETAKTTASVKATKTSATTEAATECKCRFRSAQAEAKAKHEGAEECGNALQPCFHFRRHVKSARVFAKEAAEAGNRGTAAARSPIRQTELSLHLLAERETWVLPLTAI
jgi:hypothetical protein